MTKKPKLGFFINSLFKQVPFAPFFLNRLIPFSEYFDVFLNNYPQKSHKSLKNIGYLQ